MSALTPVPSQPDAPPDQHPDSPDPGLVDRPARPGRPDLTDLTDRLRLVRVLLLGEVVLAAVATVEASVVTAGLGPSTAANAALTLGVAVALVVAVRRTGRGRVRLAAALQLVFLAMAGVDLVVSAAQQVPPLLVPLLVRVALPLAVLVLVRDERRAVR